MAGGSVFAAPTLATRDAEGTVQWLLSAEPGTFPFSNVVFAATGKRIVPVGTNSADADFLNRFAQVIQTVLVRMNRQAGDLKARRINEVSSVFENELQKAINSSPDFASAFPRNARGQLQRAGYPDLRCEDRKQPRIFYLDPKLFEAGGEGSSFRTFYFEARKETNKILEDGHHLLLGVEHNGKSDGKWKFTRWHLVDLSRVHVRLKAEFQTSNQELYQKSRLLRSGSVE